MKLCFGFAIGPALAGRDSVAPRRERAGGLTLIELMIYMGIVLLVAAPLISVILASTRSVAEADVFNRSAERNRVVLHRIGQEVRQSITATIQVSVDGKSLTLTRAAGVNAGGVLPGDVVRYELVNGPAAGEGRLDRRNITQNEVVTISGHIDVATSSFSWDGNAVTASIATVGRLPKDGSVFNLSKSVSVNPRN